MHRRYQTCGCCALTFQYKGSVVKKRVQLNVFLGLFCQDLDQAPSQPWLDIHSSLKRQEEVEARPKITRYIHEQIVNAI